MVTLGPGHITVRDLAIPREQMSPTTEHEEVRESVDHGSHVGFWSTMAIVVLLQGERLVSVHLEGGKMLSGHRELVEGVHNQGNGSHLLKRSQSQQ